MGPYESQPELTFGAIDVHLEIDGQRNDVFRTTSFAIDSNREEALQRAIREWNVSCGLAIVDALRSSDTHAPPAEGSDASAASRPPPLPLGPYTAYPGPTGTRGDVPPGWRANTPEVHAEMLRPVVLALDELIPAEQRPGFHTLKITLHVRNAAAGEGDCRIDSRPSERLCELMRQYHWPPSAEGFLFKQYYVLVPRARETPAFRP